ncbi:MAG TPA: hypothetical protein VEB21_20615, partial [Terriglobales bacterium]|nr:hypothetical protein [Terriglobales bacterium]
DDCPGGVCVIAQGVCSDGFICDCPSGECSNAVRCQIDQTFGTCASGVTAGLCCDVALNCPEGDACVGTARVCVGGMDQGFSCSNNSQCRNGSCTSTGCFCEGGDFDAFTCVNTNDCPGGGTCSCLSAATPTTAPSTPTQPTAVPTATRPVSTPIFTSTPGPTSPFPTNTPLPTSTFVPVDTNTPAPTNTPEFGQFATTAIDAPAGANKLRLTSDPRTLPVQGVVEVFGRSLRFTRRRSSPVLDLQEEFGLPFAVAAGTVVRLVESTPTPGPSGNEIRGEADGGCNIIAGPSNDMPVWLLVAGAAVLLVRRRRA